MGINIPKYVLEKTKFSESELLIEIATHLYDIEKLTMGQARRLTGLDQVSFQKELARRNIYMKYDLEDLETDLKTIADLNEIND